MTSKRDRSEDLLREMRTPVVPVDSPEIAEARRERTVSHLRGLQARATVRREIHDTWMKRVLIAAAILLPSGALAMSQVPWTRTLRGMGPPATAMADTEALHRTPRKHASVHAGPATADREPQAPPPAASVAPAVDRGASAATPPVTPSRTVRPDRAVEESTLPAENRLMQTALAAARGGDDARAITSLNELLTRYPASPLAQNAKVERFRALARSGAVLPAATEARRYLNEHPNGMASDEARTLAAASIRAEPGNARFP